MEKGVSQSKKPNYPHAEDEHGNDESNDYEQIDDSEQDAVDNDNEQDCQRFINRNQTNHRAASIAPDLLHGPTAESDSGHLQIEWHEHSSPQAINHNSDYLQPIDHESVYLQPIDHESAYLQSIELDNSFLRRTDSVHENVRGTGNIAASNQQSVNDDHYEEICNQNGMAGIGLDNQRPAQAANASTDQPTAADTVVISVHIRKKTCAAISLVLLVAVNLILAAGVLGWYNRRSARTGSTVPAAEAELTSTVPAAEAKLTSTVQPVTMLIKSNTEWTAFGVKVVQQTINRKSEIWLYNVTRNVNTGFNISAGSFIAPFSLVNQTLYWMHVSAVIPVKLAANILLLPGTSLIIRKTYTDIDSTDTVSKSAIVQLKPRENVAIRSDHSVETAYWSTFQLNDVMQPLVAFCVASSQSTYMNTTRTTAKIIYHFAFVNYGNAWDAKASCMIVPHAGIYLLAVSIGFRAPINGFISNSAHEPHLAVYLSVSSSAATGTRLYYVMQIGLSLIHSCKNETNVASSSRLLELPQGATVVVKCIGNYNNSVLNFFYSSFYIHSTSYGWETSLSAFYYSPVSRVQVAWSVARISSAPTDCNLLPRSLTFNDIRINIDDVWNTEQNAAMIKKSGIYYTVVILNTCCNHATQWLTVNGKRVFEISATASKTSKVSHYNRQTRENGAVIRLSAGDKVTVQVLEACFWYSPEGYNSFFGILLAPDNI